MLSRAIPAVLAGPVAGVVLDRMDRKRVMIASDVVRAVMALAFLLTIHQPRPWLLYLLSAALMFASPFFTSGRAAKGFKPSQSQFVFHLVLRMLYGPGFLPVPVNQPPSV